MTANHNSQPHQYALHTFRRQSNRRDGGYFTGRQTLPVAEPENCAFSLRILPRRDLPQGLINLLQLNALADDIKAIRTGHFRLDLVGFRYSFRLGEAPLGRQRRFEMIMYYVGRNDF